MNSISVRRQVLISILTLTGIVTCYCLLKKTTANFFIEPGTVLLHIVPVLGFWTAFLIPVKLLPRVDFYFDKFRKHYTFYALALSVLAFFILFWVNRRILFSFFNSADEHSCYFMAQYLAAGKLWATPHPLKEFFETPHIGIVGNKWFSVYPPGWPLVWAMGLKLHLQDCLNPLLTGASVFWMFRLGKRIYGAGPSLLTFIFLMISPFFLLNGASYHSHNLCLLLMLLYLEAVMNWNEKGHLKWAVWAGVLLGTGVATRYLTAAAMGFPAAAYLGWKVLNQRGKGFKKFFVFSVIFLILTGFHFYYNFLITGNFLNPPNHFLHSHEKLGFIAGYTPQIAIEYFFKRILYMIDWTPPWMVILFIFTLVPARIRGLGDAVFRLNVILLPAAYFFYYSWGGNQYGPRYLFEGYPCLLLTVTAFFVDRWRQSGARMKQCILGFMIAVFFSSFPILIRNLDFFRIATMERRSTYAEAETNLQYPAIVFIKGFLGNALVMSPEDSVRNSPFLNAPVVYAHDMGQENHKLKPFFLNYHQYRAIYDRHRRRPEFKKLEE